jgi:proline iminopeptidase
MSEAETLFGEEHVRRYRETGGEVGHRWKRGSKILLLTTKGRKSGGTDDAAHLRGGR